MSQVQAAGGRPRLLPKIVPDYKGADVVQLTLIKRNNRWWVLNPPVARVSRDALIKNYEGSTECSDLKSLDHPAESLKQECLEAQENLKVLKEMPN